LAACRRHAAAREPVAADSEPTRLEQADEVLADGQIEGRILLVFQVHSVDASGRVVVAKAIRQQAAGFFASLPPCLVGFEACGSAHHWARELIKLGHDARMMPPAHVKCPSSDDLRHIARFRKGGSGSFAVEIMRHAVGAARTIGDCLSFGLFAFEEDGLSPSEVDIGRPEIGQVLVVSRVVVLCHEGGDLALEIGGPVIVLKQDAVLERLVPALDLALCLRVIRGAAEVFHFLLIEPLREIVCAQSPRLSRHAATNGINGQTLVFVPQGTPDSPSGSSKP
jgi:hypothetical protein